MIRAWHVCLVALAMVDVAKADRDDEIFQAVVLSETCASGAGGKYHVVTDLPRPLEDRRIPNGWRRSERTEPWPHLEICAGARIVDASVVEGIFARETTRPRSWEGFYTAYPEARGLFHISVPVFAPDGNAAIVHIDRTCDILCGGGMLIELRKEQGRWRVVRREGTWIA